MKTEEQSHKFNLEDHLKTLKDKRISQDFISRTPLAIDKPEIQIRKPTKHEFFRVHPTDQYCYQGKFLDFGINGGLYFVNETLWGDLTEDLEDRYLILAANRAGDYFLWPIKTGNNQWNTSSISVAVQARVSWVKLKCNRSQRCYQSVKAVDTLPDPIWPTESIDELIKSAFGPKYITEINHHVLRELRGEI